jgi:hypothetical protein
VIDVTGKRNLLHFNCIEQENRFVNRTTPLSGTLVAAMEVDMPGQPLLSEGFINIILHVRIRSQRAVMAAARLTSS